MATPNPEIRDDDGYLVVVDWQSASDDDSAMLATLFEKYPPGTANWRLDLATTRVRWISSDIGDYRCLEFEAGQALPLGEKCVVDLIAPDEDGVPIMLICFSRQDRLRMVEFIRADGLAIQKMPAIESFAPWEGDRYPRRPS